MQADTKKDLRIRTPWGRELSGGPDKEYVHKESVCSYSADCALILHKRDCLEQYILNIINSSLCQK